MRRRKWNADGALRVGAQLYNNRYKVSSLVRRIGGRAEADRDIRVIVVGDGNGSLRRCARRNARRKRAKAELHFILVIVGGVRVRGEGKRLLRVAAVEGDAGRHRIVGVGGPALVGRGDRDDHLTLGVRAQGDCHLDRVLHVRRRGNIGFRDGVRAFPKLDGDRNRGLRMGWGCKEQGR